MIDLFIDLGNSRIKLAIVDNDNYEFLGAFPLAQLSATDNGNDFFAELDIDPQHIYVSSVADAAIELTLRQLIADQWQLLPIFMSTQSECCQIQNGYEQAHQLGVDRWMAIMGARSLTSGSFIVIDAGTAITVDTVYDDQHLGGLIVPGIATMRESLTAGTANLNAQCDQLMSDEGDSNLDSLAVDTQSAICGGTLYMAAAFASTIVEDIQSKYVTHLEVYITGGDGPVLGGLIGSKCEYIEDLVLLGMINIKENLKKC